MGHPQLDPAKRASILARIAEGQGARVIARAEGVNPKTVWRLRKQFMEATGKTPVPATAVPALGGSATDRKIVALTSEVARLRAALREAHTQRTMDDAVLDIIGDLYNAPSAPPDWLREAVELGKPGIEVPVVMFADWHCSEVVSKGETNGFNEFNLSVAEDRIRRLVDNTISLCREHHNKSYPGIVCALVGDFVSGALHPELAKTDELEILPTVLWVLDRLEAAIQRLADEFGRVYVPCVAGNHGRNTIKPEFKRYAYKNFDWLIYQLLARRFAANELYNDFVTFQIEETNTAFFRVFNKRFMLVHGDQMGVKGGDGIIGAIGPIMRGTIKVRGQQMTMGRDFDYLLLGHWHQMLWLPQAIVANSLKGFDEYAQNSLRAVPSLPSQPLFFVHPKYGITSRWEIYLEKPKAANAAAPWVSVFKEAA
jgi:predicted phosphodiesterase